MGSGLLVAHIHDPDPLLHTPVEKTDDVPTGQGEDDIHTFGFEGPGHDLAPVDLHQDKG
jgi:hypothetical protein